MPSHPRFPHPSPVAALTACLVVAVTASCRDLPATAPNEQAIADAAQSRPATAAATSLAARALAANCFQCHGTDGFASELKIAGESTSEIVSELNEMRAEDPRRNIMNVHATAYTPAEITLIADYFSQQGR